MSIVGPLARDAHIWARHPDDFYVEPQWLDKRIFEEIKFFGSVVDPCCGLGRVVEAAVGAGLTARGYDKVKRSSWCSSTEDFMAGGGIFDNIVCNPPFGIAQKFVTLALACSRRKTVMILPARFGWGDDRSRWLERTHPRQI